jgi:hypothetical protein
MDSHVFWFYAEHWAKSEPHLPAKRLNGDALEMTIPSERKGLFGMLFERRAA